MASNIDRANRLLKLKCTCHDRVVPETKMCPSCSAMGFLGLLWNAKTEAEKQKLLAIRCPDWVKRDSLILMGRILVATKLQRDRLGAKTIAGIKHFLANNPERCDFDEVIRRFGQAIGYYQAKVMDGESERTSA